MVCLSNIALFANHWTPESAAYSDNMALYCVIQINGEEQLSDQLEVGVFCGDECRGSAIVSEFWLTHRYLAIVTIYGENGHQLTFKLYDHGLGEELELTSPAAITFDVDGYGNPIEPYVLNFTGEPSEVTQTITLSEGWNWISAYVDITLDDLKSALVEALGNTTIRIKSNSSATTWNGNRWRGEMDWDVTGMYKIQVANDCTITLEGVLLVPANHSIPIVPGANYIGYPFASGMSLNTAFSGFAISGDKVKSTHAQSSYNGNLWRGNVSTLEPGQGYIYISNSSENRVFTFPTNAK